MTTRDISVESIYESHTGQHTDCPPCFAIKLRTVQFQGMEAGQHRFTDKERDRDLREYKKLRQQGYQPRNVFGSAELAAQAHSSFEVEHKVVMAPNIRKEMESQMNAAKEMLGVPEGLK
jgi:hypothetical protein